MSPLSLRLVCPTACWTALSGCVLGTSNSVCSNGTIALLPGPALLSASTVSEVTSSPKRVPRRKLGSPCPRPNRVCHSHQILWIYLPVTFLIVPFSLPPSAPQVQPLPHCLDPMSQRVWVPISTLALPVHPLQSCLPYNVPDEEGDLVCVPHVIPAGSG